jgi:hypothetical protein
VPTVVVRRLLFSAFLSLVLCPDIIIRWYGLPYSLDWLLEKAFLESLRVDDEYANNRLGFKAPNVFVMELTR